MKTPSTITIAMMKDTASPTWMAQIHIEFKNTPGKEVLALRGDGPDPLRLLNHCSNALERRLKKLKP